MPKREDERQLRLSGKHAAYCTCTECTERFLNRRTVKRGQGVWRRWFGKSGGETVKPHPKDCACATCNLLRSVGSLSSINGRKPGILGKIAGKILGKK